MKMKLEELHIIFTLIINPATGITITWNMINGVLYIRCMKHVSLTVNSRTFYISKNTFKGETYAVFDRSKRKIC